MIMALTDQQIEMLGDDLVPIFQQLEYSVICDIARRVAKTGRLTETAEIMVDTLRDKGYSPIAIQTQVMRVLGANAGFQREIESNTLAYKRGVAADIEATRTLLDEQGPDTWEQAGNMAFNADLSAWQGERKPIKDSAFDALVSTMSKRMRGELRSLTKSMGFRLPTGDYVRLADAYTRMTNLALVKVASGSYSYQQAIEDCVRDLARSGLRTIDFESGKSYQLDTAVRNAVMTASSQLAGEITMHNIDQTGAGYVEVSAHWGARTGIGHANHAAWQGKVYKVDGTDGVYPNLESETGYPSDPKGLCGYNCRHTFYPFWPGISEPNKWPAEPEPKEWNGRTYDYYSATQEQRRREREIRALKRERDACEAAGLTGKAKQLGGLISTKTAEYEDFSEAVEISPKKNRLKVTTRITKPKAGNSAFMTHDDPIREKIGPAFQSHPNEVDNIINYLRSRNVEIRYRSGTMAYMPSVRKGQPGRFVIDPEASYSAWLHEKQHVADDEASGWDGMRLLIDPSTRAEMEERAYDIELDFARQYGYNDVVEELQKLKEASILEIKRGEDV